MQDHQLVLKLNATVSSIKRTSSMVSAHDTQSEVKTCKIGDLTGTILLSLWDSQIDDVTCGRTYEFTNLTTRSYNGVTNLTTTRNTKIKLSTTITLPTTSSIDDDFATQTNTVTQTLEGSTISIKKLCPKGHSTQANFSSKQQFHRCTTCKILRKQESYITKCNGSIIFQIDGDEISMAIPNSVLTKFIKKEKEITFLDAQDIENYLLTCGPVTVTYTDDNHVIEIDKSISIIEETSNETEEIDDELCNVTDAVSLNKNAEPTQHAQPKQTQPTKD
ncbi:hypothetical protein R3I94_004945 [Phoxinus phoxinus]